MPIRGSRPIKPTKGGQPTGMFSSKGRQKQDGASGPHMDTLKYAHSTNTRVEHTGDNAQGARHQKNFGKSAIGHSKHGTAFAAAGSYQKPVYSNPKIKSAPESPRKVK